MNTRFLGIIYASVVTLALAVGVGLLATPQQVKAANEPCPNGTFPTNNTNGPCVCPDGTQQITVSIDSNDSHCIPINPNSASLSDNPIFFYLKNILKFLAGGIGLAVVGGIVYGGYMYITARANAGQVEKAKVVIINSVIGLILFIFMFAILQFLIPGGIFG